MNFKYAATAAILACATSLTQALEPYIPNDDTATLVASAEMWGEIYPLDPDESAEALMHKSVTSGNTPSDRLAGVMIDEQLYVVRNGISTALAETEFKVTRSASPVTYDFANCASLPVIGDKMSARFEGDAGHEGPVAFEAVVIGFYMLGVRNDTFFQLNPDAARACRDKREIRIFFEGILAEGAAFQLPVFGQYVFMYD